MVLSGQLDELIPWQLIRSHGGAILFSYEVGRDRWLNRSRRWMIDFLQSVAIVGLSSSVEDEGRKSSTNNNAYGNFHDGGSAKTWATDRQVLWD